VAHKPEEIAAKVTADIRGYVKAMRESVRETANWDKNVRAHLAKADAAKRKSVNEEERLIAKSNRLIRKNADERRKAADRAIRDETRKVAAIQRAAAREQASAMSRIRQGVAGRGGGMLSGVLGAAGVMGGMALVKDVRDFEAAITDLQVTGDKTTEWADSTRNAVLSVSDATGKSKGEVVSYLKAIIEQTGDADYAIQTLKQMGDVAVATGANMGDLGSMAVKMGGSMKLAAKDTLPAMGILRKQEKLGSFTMGNIAQSWGKVAVPLGGFGARGLGVEGVTAVGGLLQMAARQGSADDPQTTATSTQRFLERLGRDPRKIEKALGMAPGTLGTQGKNGFEYRALPEVFRAIGEASAKNKGAFASQGTKLFGLEGVKVAAALQQAAIGGWGNASGKYAAASSLFDVTGAQGLSELNKDKAKVEASAAHKFDLAMTRLTNTFQRQALPLVTKLIEHLPKFVSMIKFMLDHSTSLIALWLGAKGIALFKAMSGGGVGGGPGGDFIGPREKAKIGWGRIGMTSLAMAPFAIDVGRKIGEAFAGTSMAKIRAEFELIRKQDELAVRNKAQRKAVEAWTQSGWQDDWQWTKEGQEATKKSWDLLGRGGGTLWRDMENQEQFAFSAGETFKKLGMGGTETLIGDLKSQYQAIVGAAQADFASRPGNKGMVLTEGAVERENITAKALGTMMRELERIAIEQRKTAAGKADFKINPKIVVNVSVAGNQVGGRVRGASVFGEFRWKGYEGNTADDIVDALDLFDQSSNFVGESIAKGLGLQNGKGM
jgi:hypothetical protein